MAAKQVIDWQRVPWSLWAYVALTTVEMLVTTVTVSVPRAPLIFFVVCILAWNFFLLKGLRWLWIGTAVLFAAILGIDLVTGGYTWKGEISGLIELGLLLAPATRRFFGGGKPAVSAA